MGAEMRWVVNHNPFYFLSALFVLAGLRLTYGQVEAGQLNCWGMLASLAAYTVVMAFAAVLVIRLGKVWDDARSLLLTLVLLFVATSVSYDELLQIRPGDAAALALFGYLFAASCSEAVLRVGGIRLPWVYRGPYHLTLSLLFFFPWFVSPELHDLNASEVRWRLLAFPASAAVIALTLWPAVGRDAASVRETGPPWRWPTYPWSLFVFLACVVVGRTFVLAWSFEPAKRMAISIGPLHLLPLACAVGLLLLRAGRVHGRPSLRAVGLTMPAAVFLLTMSDPSAAQWRMLQQIDGWFSGSEWGGRTSVAVSLLIATYAAAWLDGTRVAGLAAVATAAALSWVAPGGATFGWGPTSLTPAVASAAVLSVIAWRRRSDSALVLTLVVTGAVALTWPSALILDRWRYGLLYHGLLLALMVRAAGRPGVFRDFLRGGLRLHFVWGGPLILIFAERAGLGPVWTTTYVGLMAAVAYVYGRAIDDFGFVWAAVVAAVFVFVAAGIGLLRWIAEAYGWVPTLVLSAGGSSFAVGGAISWRKAIGRQRPAEVLEADGGSRF